jgi:BirA family biotin operon repressor/biotin-[acetyl-CoA-carboxylase] ligase
MMEFLDYSSIWNALSPALRDQLHLDIFATLDSTNQYALHSPHSCYACLAEYQTQGRGRQGKRWISPMGSGLCLSLKYRYPQPHFSTAGLNLTLALTVAQQIRALGATAVGVKWPNDIGWKQRKLAGLLLETRVTSIGYDVVVGIGLNINLPTDVEIDQAWTDLHTVLGYSVSRNAVASQLIEHGMQTLQNYPLSDMAALPTEWDRFDLLKAKKIQVIMPKATLVGIASGIDSSGALRLQVGDTQVPVYYGEASICMTETAST